jgi:iron-sulfur cluster repair protein YtfE (RIC family)
MDRADLDRIATDHDYIWARLPFVAPMAVKLAHECRTGQDRCSELVELVVELRALLLDHLEREEHTLACLAPDVHLARAELASLHEEHVLIGALLARIRAALDGIPGDRCSTERALDSEIARLDHHVRIQVALEESILAGYVASAAGGPAR